ncbi:MAG: DUF2283 domain-containing protein [Dehalococcoidia bacterium]|jgi:uncharacterized protein YuzE
MKIRYDKEEDIVTFDVSSEKIDHAEEIGPIIVHFSKQGKPVLLEILDASEFIAETTRAMTKSKGGEFTEVFG